MYTYVANSSTSILYTFNSILSTNYTATLVYDNEADEIELITYYNNIRIVVIVIAS